MKAGTVLSVVVAALLSAGRAWGAQVEVTTDKPVYKVGTSAKVHLTVKNNGPEVVRFQNTYWRIQNGSTVFASAAGPYFELPPGASMTWSWDKKYGTGSFAPAGTYFVWVDMTVGILKTSVYRWFALTPSGRIAGTNRFPLTLGDQYQYATGASNPPIYQSTFRQEGSWFDIYNLLGSFRWVQRVGTTLYSKPDVGGTVGPLFRFSKPVGYTYPVSIGTLTGTLKVGATSETVDTPAGRFTGCYRLDVVGPNTGMNGYLSLWFYGGVGIVQFTRQQAGQVVTARLQYASVRGSDGQTYKIGTLKF